MRRDEGGEQQRVMTMREGRERKRGRGGRKETTKETRGK